MLTGAEIAAAVHGVDLAADPLAWLTGPPDTWLVATVAGRPAGLVATAGDACYPMLPWLGTVDRHVLGDLLTAAVGHLAGAGAREVVADVDAYRETVLAAMDRTGF